GRSPRDGDDAGGCGRSPDASWRARISRRSGGGSVGRFSCRRARLVARSPAVGSGGAPAVLFGDFCADVGVERLVGPCPPKVRLKPDTTSGVFRASGV